MTARAAAMLLAASALLALPDGAFAADIAATTRTRATLRVTSTYTPGVFESVADVDWYKVRLVAGEDYAVSGDVAGGMGLRLRDARGRVVSPTSDSDGDYTDTGLEFRAPATGTYFVEAKPFDLQPFPADYVVRVAPDCRGDRGTRCALRVGAAQQRVTAWYSDQDWFRVALSLGRNYRLDVRGSAAQARFVTAGGAALGGASGFTPGAGGTYYVEVKSGEDEGQSYTVELLTP